METNRYYKSFNKWNYNYKFDNIIKFTDTNEKYEFLCNFKTGGISHCNRPGIYKCSVTGIDIASQYSASCLNMYIPCGESRWINEDLYLNKPGFYHIKNLKFISDSLFKPCVDKSSDNKGSLDWASNNINNAYLSNYDIEYLKVNHGLVSFNIERALISDYEIKGSEIFGSYINTLYFEKAKQDELKNDKDIKYNPAYREVIKLFLNSLTGKLVENPAKYFKVEFIKTNDDLNDILDSIEDDDVDT